VREDDKFSVFQGVTAMFEAHGRAKPSPAALKLYWDAIAQFAIGDFDAAMSRAARELTWPAKPAELRQFCHAAKLGGPGGPVQHRCHFHGDGEYHHPKVGRPNEPSTSPTMWWCDRCTYFVGRGEQEEDLRGLPEVQAAVRAMADGKELP
jgi:hypothetical protein